MKHIEEYTKEQRNEMYKSIFNLFNEKAKKYLKGSRMFDHVIDIENQEEVIAFLFLALDRHENLLSRKDLLI